MTAPTAGRIVTAWFGAFVVDRSGAVVEAFPAPVDPPALAERRARRHEGRLTPEEERLLDAHPGARWEAHDARLRSRDVAPATWDPPSIDPSAYGHDPASLRPALLEEGARRLRESWDPSIYVEEAVRAATDLDRAINLLGERLASWAGRDGVLPSEDEAVLEGFAEDRWTPVADLPPVDPALAEGRRALARLVVEARRTRRLVAAAVATSVPGRAPNLSALLGPDLAAKLISQAGGLDRLARLPASTVQVLGAEKAFFEHLRGRAPPPRHGLLFVHPTIQSAPRALRGRLARALAGKAAIAARQDLAGSPVDPAQRAAYDRRAAAIRAAGPTRRARRDGRPRRSSRPPLDRAAPD